MTEIEIDNLLLRRAVAALAGHDTDDDTQWRAENGNIVRVTLIDIDAEDGGIVVLSTHTSQRRAVQTSVYRAEDFFGVTSPNKDAWCAFAGWSQVARLRLDTLRERYLQHRQQVARLFEARGART